MRRPGKRLNAELYTGETVNIKTCIGERTDPCAAANLASPPLHLIDHVVEFDDKRIQGAPLGLQLGESIEPPVGISLHGLVDRPYVWAFTTPRCVLLLRQINCEFLGRPKTFRHILFGLQKRSCRTGDNVLYRLVAVHNLQPEIAILQHFLKYFHILHWQPQVLETVLEVLCRQCHVFQCRLQKLVHLIDMPLQDSYDIDLVVRHALKQQVYSKRYLSHKPPQLMASLVWSKTPYLVRWSIVLVLVEQCLTAKLCISAAQFWLLHHRALGGFLQRFGKGFLHRRDGVTGRRAPAHRNLGWRLKFCYHGLSRGERSMTQAVGILAARPVEPRLAGRGHGARQLFLACFGGSTPDKHWLASYGADRQGPVGQGAAISRPIR